MTGTTFCNKPTHQKKFHKAHSKKNKAHFMFILSHKI